MGTFSDTSNIVDGQQIDAADVKTPIDALDDALAGFQSGSNAFTSIDVNGGAMDGTTIGANSAAAGTFTTLTAQGEFTVGTNSNARDSHINGPAASFRHVFYETAGSRRWALYTQNNAESGSNAGSDFAISRWTDAGGYIGDVIVLTRSSGKVRIVNELEIDGALNHDGSTVGFYGTTPASKQTVSGSRGANAALASLLTALATIGLITDSSS